MLTILSFSACLSACGGGGGGATTPAPVTPTAPTAPTATGPASNSSADLIAYAMDGGTTTSFATGSSMTLNRTVKTERVDGQTVTVTVDHLPGGQYGLISYRDGDTTTYYTLDDGLVATRTPTSAYYIGSWDTNYRMNGGNLVIGDGDFSITLNMEAGVASYGGMSSAADGSSSVEVYGDATVTNGTFNDSNGLVVLRGNGVYTNETAGNVSGIFVGTGATAGVTGLTNAADSSIGFEMTGGFSGQVFPLN